MPPKHFVVICNGPQTYSEPQIEIEGILTVVGVMQKQEKLPILHFRRQASGMRRKSRKMFLKRQNNF